MRAGGVPSVGPCGLCLTTPEPFVVPWGAFLPLHTSHSNGATDDGRNYSHHRLSAYLSCVRTAELNAQIRMQSPREDQFGFRVPTLEGTRHQDGCSFPSLSSFFPISSCPRSYTNTRRGLHLRAIHWLYSHGGDSDLGSGREKENKTKTFSPQPVRYVSPDRVAGFYSSSHKRARQIGSLPSPG
jgi:hypothetical protein